MIEYIYKLTTIDNSTAGQWRKIPHGLTPATIQFQKYLYRINGIVYTKNSLKFREAFNKHGIWEKLNATI